MTEANYAVLPSASRYSGSAGVWVILTGAVAQLGARLHGMEEVEGSNPFGSTTLLLRKLPSSHRTAAIELASCQWAPVSRGQSPPILLGLAVSFRPLFCYPR